jgi:hypothetical protein
MGCLETSFDGGKLLPHTRDEGDAALRGTRFCDTPSTILLSRITNG